MWSTGKSATLRPPSPQKPPSPADSQVVTTTTTSSAATAAPGPTSTRVPLPAVAPEGASSDTDTDTHAPRLGDMTTASTSAIPPAWKVTHRTTIGMERVVASIRFLLQDFSSFLVRCWGVDAFTVATPSFALCRAVVGSERLLLGSPWHDQAALYLFQKYSRLWEGVSEIDRKHLVDCAQFLHSYQLSPPQHACTSIYQVLLIAAAESLSVCLSSTYNFFQPGICCDKKCAN